MRELRYKAGDLLVVLVDGPTQDEHRETSRGWHKKGDIVRVHADSWMDYDQVLTIDDNAPANAYGHTVGSAGWNIHYTQLAHAPGYSTKELIEYLGVLDDFKAIDRGLAIEATKKQWCPEYEKEIANINEKLSEPRLSGKRAVVKTRMVSVKHYVVDGEDNLANDINESHAVIMLSEV